MVLFQNCVWWFRPLTKMAAQLNFNTKLHCGGHLGGRAQLPETILENDHPMTIPSKFASN
jgi:lysozyme family protein